MSSPMDGLPCALDSINVVPDPQNGSQIILAFRKSALQKIVYKLRDEFAKIWVQTVNMLGADALW